MSESKRFDVRKAQANLDEALANVTKLATGNRDEVEPSADLRQQARYMREVYVSYLDAGFTRNEALFFTSMPMRETIQYELDRQRREGDL